MALISAPTFHIVDVIGDEGSVDYKRSALLLWKALQSVEVSHRTQTNLAEIVEHVVATMQAEPGDTGDSIASLLELPLARLCADAFLQPSSLQPFTVQQADGLVAPSYVDSRLLCETIEPLTYSNFFNTCRKLSSTITQGEVYSACESRWNVLRARFRLHRAFNADTEDHHHVVLGGGDMALAAKTDVRRIGTCVCSSTLVNFMRLKVAELAVHSSPSTTTAGRSVDGAAEALSTSVEQFFGPNRPESEQLLTAEGLSLHPNFAQVTERRLDVFEKHNPMRPRADNALQLLRHFLKFQYGEDGRYFAELITSALPHAISRNEYLELELTVHGLRKGEVAFIADWFHRFELYRFEPSIRVCLRIVLMELQPEKYPDCRSFADVLGHIFAPLWDGLLRPLDHPRVAKFLSILNGVSVAVDDASEGQTLPLPGVRAPSMFNMQGKDGQPPDAYFFFYVWRNTQLFNFGILASLLRQRRSASVRAPPCASMDRALTFRIHSDNKLRSFAHCVTGLLIGDTIANPMRITQWSPLGYLYYLTQRHVVLTPSVNNAMNAPFPSSKSALVALIEVGANVSVASMDPLHHHGTDYALQEELHLLRKVYHLSATDLTELCLRSMENANLSVPEIRVAYPNSIPWSASRSGLDLVERRQPTSHAVSQPPYWELLEAPATLQHYNYHSHRRFHSVTSIYNRFAETQVPTVRLAFREACHQHELLLMASTVRVPHGLSGPARDELASTTTWRRHQLPAELHIAFPRLRVRGPQLSRPSTAAKQIIAALTRRELYRVFALGSPDQMASRDMAAPAATASSRERNAVMLSSSANFQMRHGVIRLEHNGSALIDASTTLQLPSWEQYVEDYRVVRRLAHDSEAQIFCKRRLATLEHKFHLHRALMDSAEQYPATSAIQYVDNDDGTHILQPSGLSQRTTTGKTPKTTSSIATGGPLGRSPASAEEFSDWYRSIKVDVHCHMASGMTAKQLLEFMQSKAREAPDDVVAIDAATGKPVTVLELLLRITRQRFGSGATVGDLTVSALDVQASSSTFNRFDQFNNKYNPLGVSELRSLFLKTDNFMGGRYFAELIKKTFQRQQERGGVYSEFRLSIYGRRRDEWRNLAVWWSSHGMSHRTNRWIVQVPRIYDIYKKEGSIASFAELLENIFAPLWEVTLRPASDSILAAFLQQVSGFDSVDNESGNEADPTQIRVLPEQWTSAENPPFSYWMYHMWANICSLNHLRVAKQLLPFSFRPHCGESGDPDHLVDAFLLADGIGHGIQLRKRSALQYLFYMTQIGLGMTPLSNNALFCRYHENPFPQFFSRGLLVALSTDGPLQFHHTDDPLTEEYAMAMKFWNFSTVDACEIASHSVRMSSFQPSTKRKWHGDLHMLRSTAGNDVAKTRVPHCRVAFRYELYDNECRYLEQRAALVMPHRAMLPVSLEDLVTIDSVGLTRAQVLERRLRGLPVARSPAPSEFKAETSVPSKL